MSNWNFFRLRMNIKPSSTVADWEMQDITAGTSANVTSLINGSTVGGQTQPMVDPSGTRVYIPEFNNKRVRQLSLSSANDLSSTISNVGVSSAFSYNFSHFQMSRDGTKGFIKDYSGNNIYQYNLSTAWDITTMSTTAANTISYTTPSGNWVERGLHFNTDGTELYFILSSFGATAFAIKAYKYVLSTAYDLSTAATVDVIDITTSADPDPPAFGGNIPSNIIIFENSIQTPYYLIFGPGEAAAYTNSVANASVIQNGYTSYEGAENYHSSNDNDNAYYLERSGPTNNYTWTLYQYNINPT